MHTQSYDTHQTSDSTKVVEGGMKDFFLALDEIHLDKHNHFIVFVC